MWPRRRRWFSADRESSHQALISSTKMERLNCQTEKPWKVSEAEQLARINGTIYLHSVLFNAFYRHCSVLYRNEPYLIGGFPTAYYQQVIKYNGIFWIQAQRLPEPIYGQICGVHDDLIWVCAGKHILGHSNRKCFLFDGENWSFVNANEARLAPQKEL